MVRNLSITLIFIASFGPLVPVNAHHSGAAYDRQTQLSIEGVVVHWKWQNPHSALTIHVEDEEGNLISWDFEGLPAGILASHGYRRSSFSPGDTVTIVYSPLRDGAPGGNLRGAILADGSKLGAAAQEE